MAAANKNTLSDMMRIVSTYVTENRFVGNAQVIQNDATHVEWALHWRNPDGTNDDSTRTQQFVIIMSLRRTTPQSSMWMWMLHIPILELKQMSVYGATFQVPAGSYQTLEAQLFKQNGTSEDAIREWCKYVDNNSSTMIQVNQTTLPLLLG